MAVNDQEYINKMYDSSLQGQKAQLQQNYEQDQANLDYEQQQAQKKTDANLNRTYVEAAKAAKNYGEVQNAYGLTSGAMAQAKLAQDNQLQGDLTAIRTAQQDADAQIERERSLLAKQYSDAIQQAQSENDLARAQALYEQAKAEEQRLRQQQQQAASMLGAAGDFSLHGSAYGMTEGQVGSLKNEYERILAEEREAEERAKQQAAAQLLAGAGDFSLYGGLYGMTPEQIAKVQGQYDSERAKEKEAEELAKQEAAAKLLAGAGDFSLYASLYGLTPEQLALINSQYSKDEELAKQEAAAKLLAGAGDYSMLGKLYGLTDEQIKLLQQGTKTVTYNPPQSEPEKEEEKPFTKNDNPIAPVTGASLAVKPAKDSIKKMFIAKNYM